MRCNKRLSLVILLMFFSGLLFAQGTITGTVSDAEGNSLQSVSITALKSSIIVITDAKGKFSINPPPGSTELEFSMVGYVTQVVDVAGKSSVSIALQPAAGSLKDVVVVGYGTQRKRDVTGTISTVKGDEFKNVPIANAAQALQGRASGVDIVSNDGSPGGGSTIRIRGTGTLNNSDPLVVIDGVPSGSLSDVNPNDIASIEILKDASASAIYGTRAANGVVLVTTKKGVYGEQLKTTVNFYTGNANPMKFLKLATAPELLLLKKETYSNDGTSVAGTPWGDDKLGTQRTDWQRALFGTGKITNADIAIRGGNLVSNYSISGNYFEEKGMIPNTFFKRYSARINSEHKIGKRIKVGENVLYSFTTGSGQDTRSTQAGLVWSALRFNPGIPVREADGSYGTSTGKFDINNPVFTVETSDALGKTNRLLANAFAEVDIISGLKFKANFAYDQAAGSGYSFSIKDQTQARTNSQASLNRSYSESTSLLNEYLLTYNKQFASSHNLNVVAGYSAQSFANDGFSAARIGFDDEAYDQRILNSGSSAGQRSSGGKSNAGLKSYFARTNYSFKGKYLLTATLRADGSSKFPVDKGWGYFPAVSAGWRISDESFFKNSVSFINTLKLTGGWGQLGNQDVPDFQYLSNIRTGGTYSFGAGNIVNGSWVGSLSNPKITWERAEVKNISLEFGLLKNSLTGTVTWFDKNTKDMLIPYQIVSTYGQASIPNQNIGTLKNRGIELDLAYRNKVGQVEYTVGANASFIKNQVTLLYGNKQEYIGSSTYGRENMETSRTYEGQPIASFYGFKTDGLYQSQGDIDKDAGIANDPNKANIVPGDVKFRDMNADGIIDDKDRVSLGSPNPAVVLGVNVGLRYKGFDLSLSFAGALGFELYNADRMAGLDANQVFNMYAEALNRWTGPGTSNTIPRLSRSNVNQNYRSSDKWVEKGDYFSLKNVSIGYTFQRPTIAGTQFPEIRLFASCYNAFYISKYSGYSPELGYTDGNRQRGVDVAQYPATRKLTIGASFIF
jgi:TonB-linked SusC/RagA family outer membrane protein